MVTYYNKKDLTSFGEYLLSERRKENIRGDLSKVHHADFENWLEEQRTKAKRQPAPEPQREVPQWLVDHMEGAPKELKEYVLRVYPKRYTSGASFLRAAFTWHDTIESHEFWQFIESKKWRQALKELESRGLI